MDRWHVIHLKPEDANEQCAPGKGEEPKDRKRAAVDPYNASRATVHSSSKRKKDSTCFADMPYVMSEFRPSEKGICRVDYIASLARELRSMLGLREKCPMNILLYGPILWQACLYRECDTRVVWQRG